MDAQYFFNASIAIMGVLLTALIYKIRALEQRDTAIQSEIHVVHLLVAGEYIKRTEFESSLKALFDALRRIEEKLDSGLGKKVDK